MSSRAEIDRATLSWASRRSRPIDWPSLRRPGKSAHFNDADRIERQLQEDGHRTWGYVIYRTCYGNDEDWAEFLRRLRFRMEAAFDLCNGRDILALFTLTVIEDPEHLNGASSAVVREHFRQWCATAPQAEQRQPQDDDTGREIGPGFSPRYRYAVQVDAASLSAVIHDAPAPPGYDLTKKGWVRLIDASWRPRSLEPDEESFEPIEGVIEMDVGWVMVPYWEVMNEYYVSAFTRNWWPQGYLRPPEVLGNWVDP